MDLKHSHLEKTSWCQWWVLWQKTQAWRGKSQTTAYATPYVQICWKQESQQKYKGSIFFKLLKKTRGMFTLWVSDFMVFFQTSAFRVVLMTSNGVDIRVRLQIVTGGGDMTCPWNILLALTTQIVSSNLVTFCLLLIKTKKWLSISFVIAFTNWISTDTILEVVEVKLLIKMCYISKVYIIHLSLNALLNH